MLASLQENRLRSHPDSLYFQVPTVFFYPDVRTYFSVLFFFLRFLKFIFREGKGRTKRGRETSVRERVISWLPVAPTPTEDQTRNSGVFPSQESNLQPFALWDDTQLTEHTSQGFSFCLPFSFLFLKKSFKERVRKGNRDGNVSWLPSCAHAKQGFNLQPGYMP